MQVGRRVSLLSTYLVAKKTAECKLLGLAMFYVVGDVAVCVTPRLLAYGHHHVTKGWAGGGTHRCSPGLL